MFNAEVTRSAKRSGRPRACTRGRVSLDGSCPTTSPTSLFPASVRDFLAQPCGRCYFPSPTHSDWNRDQDSLRVCFLRLGNAWSLLPCNTPAVSFIRSCPGKCLIHSCRRPTAGGARAFRASGAGTTASTWQQPPRCVSNMHGCQEQGTLPSFHLSPHRQDLRGNGALRRGLQGPVSSWTAGILVGSVCCGRRKQQLWDFAVNQGQPGFPSHWTFPRVPTRHSHARPWSQAGLLLCHQTHRPPFQNPITGNFIFPHQ